jgi:hypothetical protein
MITPVFKGQANYDRQAYIEFEDGIVRFDDSEQEYGPIEFDINILIDALEKHAKSCMEEVIKSYEK